MRRLVSFLAAGLLWALAGSAFAAIGTPTVLGSGASGVAVSQWYVPTTVDSPAGDARFIAFAVSSSSAWSCTDQTGQTYTSTNALTFNTSSHLMLFYAANPVDLPAPCTVTASMAVANTLVISAVGTCSASATFAAGTYVSGTSIDAQTVVSTPCTLSGGSGTCTLTGDTGTPGSETVTMSSAAKCSWTTAAKPSMGVFYDTGLATSSIIDANGVGNTTGSPGTTASETVPESGSFAQANELVITLTGIGGGFTSYAPSAGFSNIINVPNAAALLVDYQIITSTPAVTNTPTWGTSRAFGINGFSFKGASATSVLPHNLSSMDAGY